MADIGLANFRAAWTENAAAFHAAIERVGQSGWLILGEEVTQFESALAQTWGLRHAVGVANGLDALEICFRTLGAKPGNRYLTTPLSAFATTLAILRAGGIPEFVDVDDSGLLDLSQVEARLGETKNPVRFLVPVHLYGHALSVDELSRLSKRFGVSVVEDSAQAIGATSHGKPVGSASAMTATSFYPTKNLGALGDGGALLTDNTELANIASCLRDYGQSKKYIHTRVGLNSRLDELQAAFLRSVQLPLLAKQTARRRAIAERYCRELTNPALVLPPVPSGSQSVWHLFSVLVPTNRDSFRAHLTSRGVATGLHYPTLIPDQVAFREAGAPAPQSALPNARRFTEQQVSLPLHPYLSDEDCGRVVEACNAWKP